jgi:hypothetical protein
MRDVNGLTKSTMDCEQQHGTHKLTSMQEATEGVVHILDAKYEMADLQSVVSTNCTHLSLQDKNKFLELLIEFEELLDGTLGDWKNEHVSALN